MNLTWSHDISNINWVDLAQLYKIAPLGDKDPTRLSATFQNSRFRCLAFEGDAIVGVGRALSDGHDCSYICDIAIHPDYQGLGLGKRIVQDLVDQSRGHKKIILYANPGKEGFYAKLGFKRMNTAMAIFQDESAMLDNGTLSEP